MGEKWQRVMGLSALLADISYLFNIICSSNRHSNFNHIKYFEYCILEPWIKSLFGFIRLSKNIYTLKMYPGGFEQQCCKICSSWWFWTTDPYFYHKLSSEILNSEIGGEHFLGSSKHVYLDRKSFIAIGTGKCALDGLIYREFSK